MSHYKVLLIDYEPRSIGRLRTVLERAGHSVEVAADGITGIEAFHRLEPDLTLVEAMIPKKHGFEVCQELKATRHGRTSPVIIITSVYKGRRYRQQALHQHGADEFLEKPVDGERLLAVIDELVTSKATRSAAAAEPSATAEPDGAAAGPAPAGAPASPPAAGSRRESAEEEIDQRLDRLLAGGEAATTKAAPPAQPGAPPDGSKRSSGATGSPASGSGQAGRQDRRERDRRGNRARPEAASRSNAPSHRPAGQSPGRRRSDRRQPSSTRAALIFLLLMALGAALFALWLWQG